MKTATTMVDEICRTLGVDTAGKYTRLFPEKERMELREHILQCALGHKNFDQVRKAEKLAGRACTESELRLYVQHKGLCPMEKIAVIDRLTDAKERTALLRTLRNSGPDMLSIEAKVEISRRLESLETTTAFIEKMIWDNILERPELAMSILPYIVMGTSEKRLMEIMEQMLRTFIKAGEEACAEAMANKMSRKLSQEEYVLIYTALKKKKVYGRERRLASLLHLLPYKLRAKETTALCRKAIMNGDFDLLMKLFTRPSMDTALAVRKTAVSKARWNDVVQSTKYLGTELTMKEIEVMRSQSADRHFPIGELASQIINLLPKESRPKFAEEVVKDHVENSTYYMIPQFIIHVAFPERYSIVREAIDALVKDHGCMGPSHIIDTLLEAADPTAEQKSEA